VSEKDKEGLKWGIGVTFKFNWRSVSALFGVMFQDNWRTRVEAGFCPDAA
jgi:hypothetical protein